jgi:phosphoribosyl 1,2-cyclic phosphodiesterase
VGPPTAAEMPYLTARRLTHRHSDAMAGLLLYDGLLAERRMRAEGKKIPVYCCEATFQEVLTMFESTDCFKVLDFSHFKNRPAFPGKDRLTRQWHESAAFEYQNVSIQPFWASHGDFIDPLGFIIDKSILYLSDSLFIHPASLDFIKRFERQLDVAVLDMLAPLLQQHNSHQSLTEFSEQAVDINAKVTFATQTSSTAVTHHELHDFFTSLRDTKASDHHFAAFEEFKTKLRDMQRITGDRTDASGDTIALALLMAWLPFYHFDLDYTRDEGDLPARPTSWRPC